MSLELLTTYCERIDAADFDGVGALFASDGRLVDPDGRVIVSGPAAVAAFYRSIVKLHNGSPRTSHTVFDVVEGSDGVVRSRYSVAQDMGAGPVVVIEGRYEDVIADGLFVERRFYVDRTGDLSEHLLITV